MTTLELSEALTAVGAELRVSAGAAGWQVRLLVVGEAPVLALGTPLDEMLLLVLTEAQRRRARWAASAQVDRACGVKEV